MYRYDNLDRQIVADRVAEFRDQAARRLSGAISEEAFKPLRLMNGLYLQLHAYMLRVAIPYGSLNAAQMRRLAAIARRYDRGYGHFTTRQNIQYNWIKLEEAPDILQALAEVDMHPRTRSAPATRAPSWRSWLSRFRRRRAGAHALPRARDQILRAGCGYSQLSACRDARL